ncbi:MAG: YiiX/YebB-like N1pC/P60 family cysteine hydrolase, partial [Candidatus Rokuibacteriota bacterium]
RLALKHIPKLTRDDIPYAPEFRLRAIAISLLAGVTLFENARLVQAAIASIPGVRALLNQPDTALGIPRGFWERTERELYRVEYRSYLEAGAALMETAQPPPYDPHPEAEDPLLAYVGRELSTAAAIGEIRGERPSRQIARILRHYARQVTALGAGLPQQGQLRLSRTFGNVVGLVELRKGKLHGQPHWTRFVRERLQPGDVLLEKTPFRLTDAFIPGHFGHVAMYVGTEAELRALGLLDHPFVAPHRRAIAAGRTIVEALRDGTQVNTLERFLNVDDLAILRPKPDRVPAADVRQAVLLAFTHLGKRYDFAFDANTWDAIVCSELAFQSYVRVPWSLGKVLGSYTISPDDVAAQAGADPSRPFDLATFVHDGRLVHDRALGLENEALYRRLLGPRSALGADAAGRTLPVVDPGPR